MEALVYPSAKHEFPITDSRKVATAFHKQHGHVLEAIRVLVAQLPDTEHLSNFRLMEVKEEFGVPVNGVRPIRLTPVCYMTERGFTLLVMGFTGKKALQFKLDYMNQFEAMRRQLSLQQQTTTTVAATQEVARLAQYTSVPKQIACVKQVAGTLIHQPGKSFAIINHHRQVMKALTGMRPSEYVEAAVKQKLKVRGQSGRAVLRKLEPAKAATAAVMDEAIAQGKSIDEMQRAGIMLALPQAFDAIIQLGLVPAELHAGQAA